MTSYRVIRAGESRSFPQDHSFTDRASVEGDNIVILGWDAGSSLPSPDDCADASFVAIELGNECLAVHSGLQESEDNSRHLGFARFRMGASDPTALVELVHLPWTNPDAIQSATEAFEQSGLAVAVCADFPGRIVNRLLRPYLNAAMRRVDEKLASTEDMDKTLRMGLGYPEGPFELLQRTGLEDHFEVAQALYEALGQEAYAPARVAQIANQRRNRASLASPSDG
ncbi:MAG: 3-hydroxybutyryl-CoA dehydrogenase [Halioglobus sp.]|jgi:3-hydroxybutyryl-CoA dehydrogenase